VSPSNRTLAPVSAQALELALDNPRNNCRNALYQYDPDCHCTDNNLSVLRLHTMRPNL
jgi:hypothetical protein